MATPKAKQPTERGKGRPATGSTRTKISVTIPTLLLTQAAGIAFKKDESVSQFVSRAIQNLVMES